jgi:N-acetylglucosamine kinase-like BadF-type ATPase
LGVVSHLRQMAFYLGIDGGGTSTRCVVGDENRVLGTATTGSAKIARVGAEHAREALQSAIRHACSAAQINPEKISQACIGIAGASSTEVTESARAWAAEIIRGQIEVVGDMLVAHEAAFGGGPGVIVIAGTGSICFGRNEKGLTTRAGGGGPGASDEGSGHWIGYRAVKEAARLQQGSRLTSMIMQSWQLRAGSDIEDRMKANPTPDFAALFPALATMAVEGDESVMQIFRDAGAELAKLAGRVTWQLWPQPQRVPVAFSGGVFENSAIVRDTFVTQLRADLQARGYEIAVSFGLAEPVVGALSLARKAARASAAHVRS